MSADARLERSIGLLQATATNMLGMIGVGPFLTLPLMVAALGGPHILYAWLLGAVLAVCDGLVYAQLAAALPGSGGPYVYLREAYAPLGLGRVLPFVFIFQVVLVAPLSIASGAVGFADYLGFYWSNMPPLAHDLVAAGVCIAMTALLYRDTRAVGRLSVAMLVVVLLTVGWVIVAGLVHFSPARAFAFPPEAFRFDRHLASRLGGVALLAMYNYGGYNTVCNLGGEVKSPHTTLPRAILVSIALVVLLYVLTSTVVLGVVPWAEVARSHTIASEFIAHTIASPRLAHLAAATMTALILFVTASSLYALILGYSRVPFAAAQSGQFFRVFARVHPTRHFPHVALVTMGAASVPFCFVSLGRLVNWLILVQIGSQFVWQCAGVVLLHRYRKDIAQPFRMWLYPLPALVALGMWLFVFATAARDGIVFALGFFAVAVCAWFVFARASASRPV